MAVTVRIPTILRTYTQGASSVALELDDSSLLGVLDALEAAAPGIRARVLDDDGALRRFVNVYVDDDDVRFLEGLSTPVPVRCAGLDHPGRRRRLTPYRRCLARTTRVAPLGRAR